MNKKELMQISQVPIVTKKRNGTIEFINLWYPGVCDKKFAEQIVKRFKNIGVTLEIIEFYNLWPKDCKWVVIGEIK